MRCARSSMDRASDSGSECWGFESLRAYQKRKTSAFSRCLSFLGYRRLYGGSALRVSSGPFFFPSPLPHAGAEQQQNGARQQGPGAGEGRRPLGPGEEHHGEAGQPPRQQRQPRRQEVPPRAGPAEPEDDHGDRRREHAPKIIRYRAPVERSWPSRPERAWGERKVREPAKYTRAARSTAHRQTACTTDSRRISAAEAALCSPLSSEETEGTSRSGWPEARGLIFIIVSFLSIVRMGRLFSPDPSHGKGTRPYSHAGQGEPLSVGQAHQILGGVPVTSTRKRSAP